MFHGKEYILRRGVAVNSQENPPTFCHDIGSARFVNLQRHTPSRHWHAILTLGSCRQAASATEEELREELQHLEEDCQALDAQLCTQAGSQHVSMGSSHARGAPARLDKVSCVGMTVHVCVMQHV